MRPDEPPPPSRVRVVRPGFYRSERTGILAPDVRDLLFGLTTLADDEGWMLWRPPEIAAALYAYEPHARRLRALERRAAVLVAAELVILSDCGCAYLPTLKEHHGIKGGRPTSTIWAWHIKHVPARASTDAHDPSSVTSSSSVSSSDSVPSSSGAREVAPDGGGATCVLCHRPTSIHLPTCPNAPHLRAVS